MSAPKHRLSEARYSVGVVPFPRLAPGVGNDTASPRRFLSHREAVAMGCRESEGGGEGADGEGNVGQGGRFAGGVH